VEGRREEGGLHTIGVCSQEIKAAGGARAPNTPPHPAVPPAEDMLNEPSDDPCGTPKLRRPLPLKPPRVHRMLGPLPQCSRPPAMMGPLLPPLASTTIAGTRNSAVHPPTDEPTDRPTHPPTNQPAVAVSASSALWPPSGASPPVGEEKGQRQLLARRTDKDNCCRWQDSCLPKPVQPLILVLQLRYKQSTHTTSRHNQRLEKC
jgi:hypothetical protein